MTLDTSVSKAVFQGNGSAVAFPFSFRVWNAAELIVQVTGADGIARDVTAQCSIALSDDGGTVTYAPGGAPLPAGHTLVILRNMSFLQDVKLITGTRFDPAVIEEALDRATAERQQLLEKVSRAVVVPADSADPPEELADQIFEARDRAEAAAGKAAASETEAEKQADRAKAEADRAADAAILGTQAENLEAVWTLDADIPASGTLALPVSYFAGRNMLHLGYDGVELYRGPQYEETGERDELSSSVKMLIPLSRGTVMRAWAVASNVARNVEAAEERARAEADRAKSEADRAAGEADRAVEAVREGTAEAVKKAEAEADRAHDEADRAEKAAQAAELGAGALNADATWTLACPVEPGGDVILPVTYWPGRAMLYLSADRNDLFRGSDYLEIAGDGPEGRSDRVKSMCRLAEGTVMHAWVIASNVSRLVEEAERRAAEHAGSARRDAEDARESAAQAQDAAERAVSAAGEAELSRNVAQNAAQEATEQADRADEAAIDAGRYRSEALDAARCAAASAQGRSIAAVQSAALLDRVPSGFFVINGELVLPGTVQHPLTPVDSVEDIPNMDGFFLLAPPFPDCPPEPGPEPEEPDKPDEPDEPGTPGGLPAWMLPCGKRARV